MIIASIILTVVGFAGLLIARLTGDRRLHETPYRRVHGDAPGAWPPHER